MSDAIKVGFCSMQNYLDKTAFSGTLFSMHRALRQAGAEVVDLGHPAAPSAWTKPRQLVERVASWLGNEGPGEAETERRFLATVQAAIDRKACDVLFTPVGSREVSLLPTGLPIVYLSDATPLLIRDAYKVFTDEPAFRKAESLERTALSKASRAIYSSRWAADSAVRDYQGDASRIVVVPFGANVEQVPSAEALAARLDSTRCRLLFIGREWDRKGGRIAFETLVHLAAAGLDVELHMVGCVPPEGVQHPNLKVTPFLNKNLARDREAFDQILMESHFLIFPTRADCSPIVICEANAYGIPVLTTEVGGIPSLVTPGRNGYLFPLSAGGDAYGQRVVEQFADPASYRSLVRSSRAEYDQRLNWGAWARSTLALMADAVAESRPAGVGA